MGRLRKKWERSVVILFILVVFLPVFHTGAQDQRNFEITRLEVDVDIDLNGASHITERIFLKNISSNTIHSIVMNVENNDIWDFRAFEPQNQALPVFITQKGSSSYEIEIEIDVGAGEMKELWIEYLCNTRSYTSGFEDFQYIRADYKFSEFAYLGNNEYPLTIRFWAPVGLMIATDIYSYEYFVREGKYRERNYIRLLFGEKPDSQAITVILKNRDDIFIYHIYFSETIYLSERIPTVKFEGEFVSCTTFRLNYLTLPYKGRKHEIYPEGLFEIHSDSFPHLLVPRKDVYFKIGDHTAYVLKYELDDPTFKDPFFTTIKKTIRETKNYSLELIFSEKPFFLFNPPYRRQLEDVYIEESLENGCYRVRMQGSTAEYSDTINYATIFMTKNQLKTNLLIIGILLIFFSIVYRIRYFIRMNRDFIAYISLTSLFILISLIYIAFFSDYSTLNIFFYFFVAALTFLSFFLCPFFSRNLSLDYGIIFALGFFLTNHGQYLAQFVNLFGVILTKSMVRELILSILGLIPMIVLYLYLYKEKEFKRILAHLYQKIKRIISPTLLVFLILALPLCIVSTFVFFLKLVCSCILLFIFFFLSFWNFTLVFNNPEYRRENGYEVYTGIVTNITRQENENVEFQFRYSLDEDEGDSNDNLEEAFVYDNRFNYPIFGLSYDEIREDMKLMIATRKYEKRDEGLKVWIAAPI